MTSAFKWIIVIIEVGFLVSALIVAVISAGPFSWPFSWDALRDIGIAQTIYDGQFPYDPIIENEINWYNPFLGFVIAIFGKILHTPLPETYVRIGPFLALLLPVSVMLFSGKIGGPIAGLAALCYCIFARHPLLPEWIYGCYVPWLYATHIGKAFFLFFVASYLVYKESDKTAFLYFSGILLGITFLTHTSAFLEGVLILIIIAMLENKRELIHFNIREIISKTRYVFIILLVALLVSSVYWLPILLKYKMIIKNPYPSLYLTPVLEFDKILNTLGKSVNAFTTVGSISLLIFLFKRKDSRIYLLKVWCFAVVCVGLYQIFCQVSYAFGYIIPAPYPLHHTFVSLHILIGLFFGYGVSSLVKWLANKVTLILPVLGNGNLIQLFFSLIVLIISILISGYLYSFDLLPPFSELTRGRVENDLVAESQKYDGVYHWIIENTLPQDKILCDEVLGVRAVLPAGRKLVYIFMFYLNPYTELSKYIDKYNEIWSTLREKKYSDFLYSLKEERVKYIIVHNADPEYSLLRSISQLQIVYSDNVVAVFSTDNVYGITPY